MPPKKRHVFSALKPPKPLKPPKVLKAWESYSQSFQATQYTHDSLAAVVVQPIEALAAPVAVQQVVLSEDIAEAQLSSQMEDIKEEELGTVFKARGETTEDKADKVGKAEFLELLAKEVARMGLPAIPTI